MKKLKKSLSIVLVLALALSLVSGAFAAWENPVKTYTDETDISEYAQEAVATLTGMKVLDGTGDKFEGKGNFTREQAAKIVTLMKLKPEVADVQPARQVFEDVAADRWSAKYVNYANGQGIVVGDGTNFMPEQPLERVAWLKMVLVAIGYDPVKEGLQDVGEAWKENTINLALTSGLVTAEELGYEFNRECAAFYAWRAMNQPMQGVKDAYVVRKADGSIVATFDSAVEAAAFIDAYENGESAGLALNVMGTLGEKVYDLTHGMIYADAFGGMAEIWYNGVSFSLADMFANDYDDDDDDYAELPIIKYPDFDNPKFVEYSRNVLEPVATYTTSVTRAMLMEDLGRTASLDFAIFDGGINYEAYGKLTAMSSKGPVIVNDPEADEQPIDMTGYGVETRIFENPEMGPGHFYAAVKYTHVTKLTKPNIEAADPMSGDPGYVKFGGTATLETSDFAKDDVVAFHVSALYEDEEYASLLGVELPEKTKYVVDATKLTGTTQKVTAKSTDPVDPSVTIDGEKTYASRLCTKTIPNVNNDGLFFYDDYGYVLFVDNVKPREIDGYYYVMRQQAAKAGTITNLISGNKVSETVSLVQVMDLKTGEVKVLEQATLTTSKGKVIYADQNGGQVKNGDTAVEVTTIATGNDASPVNKVYAYYADEDGAIVLVDTAKNVVTNATTNDNEFTTEPTLTGGTWKVSDGITVETGKSEFKAGQFANSNTTLYVLKVKDTDLSASGEGAVYDEVEVKTYTGFQNWPKYTAVLRGVAKEGPPETYNEVYAFELPGQTAVNATTTHNYMVFKGQVSEEADRNSYKFLTAEGEMTYDMLKDDGSLNLQKGDVVDVTFTDDGTIEEATKPASPSIGTGTGTTYSAIVAAAGEGPDAVKNLVTYEAGAKIVIVSSKVIGLTTSGSNVQFTINENTKVIDDRKPGSDPIGTPDVDMSKVNVQVIGQQTSAGEIIADAIVFTDVPATSTDTP